MTTATLDKTEKGRDEISHRSHRLTPRLRTMLLLVDGKTSVEMLLKKVSGLGLGADSLQELVDQGFVVHHLQAESNEPAPKPPTSASTPNPVMPTDLAESASQHDRSPEAVAAPADAVAQIQAAHHFYNETIKEYIGLRGIGLQLKVERAATLDDYRALRTPFLQAVVKHKGMDVAHGLHLRLHPILFHGEKLPPLDNVLH